jgi:hypothetical protein
LELIASNGKSEERNAVMRDKRLFHEHLIHQKKENDASSHLLTQFAPSNHHETDVQDEDKLDEDHIPLKKLKSTKNNSKRPLSLESHSLAKVDNPYFIQYFKKDSASEKGLEVHETARFGSETLELLPDEDLTPQFKNKMAMKWDRKKKKFLHVNPQADLKAKSLVRNESGQLVSLNHYKPKLYDEWKKESKRSIPREGEMDKSAQKDNSAGSVLAKALQRRKSSSKEKDLDPLSLKPSIQKQSQKSKQGKTNKRELLSKDEIMKGRKNKVKNLTKNKPRPKSKKAKGKSKKGKR